MGNEQKAVAQTYFEITDLKHTPVTQKIDYSKACFTYLTSGYVTTKNKKKIGYNDLGELIVLNRFGQKENIDQQGKKISLQQLKRLINTYEPEAKSISNTGLLKGLYQHGFNTENIIKNAPYLFFDIDVSNTTKKKENLHLLAESTNKKIFEALKKVSVLVWRSSSGLGIAGVLYVPQMAEYLSDRSSLHLMTGKAVTAYLSQYLHDTTGIQKVTFDHAQSKLRQVRYLAKQKELRELNPYPFDFSFKVSEKIKKLAPNVIAYRQKDFRLPYGTVKMQFCNKNDILTVAQQYGFEIVNRQGNKIRVSHPDSESSSTGVINTAENVYFNYSSSVGEPRKAYSPFDLILKYQFKGDLKAFNTFLEAEGYKEKTLKETDIKKVSDQLKTALERLKDKTEADKVIFNLCFDLQTLTPQQKEAFINETCPDPDYLKYFKAYLSLPDYKLSFDKQFTINKFVAEVLGDVLNYTDKHKKILLRAETGKGKTTAFIKDFQKHRPKAKVLFLVPLTVILRQNANEYKEKAVFIDSSSSKADWQEAETESFVFATYEQGIKLIQGLSFDYIVIDEIHQLLTANSFKRSVIADLTPYLKDKNVIGLTGTPENIFKQIGYKLINVDVKNPEQTQIEVRYLNNKPFDIALAHIRNITGKAIIRLNDTKGIKILKKQLTATKQYKPSEVLVLYSTEQIKKSKGFKKLAHERQFDEKIKLILTTSLIDEGLSIEQSGFTDVVFIETNYHPRPEPIKQYFARFRNPDPNRKNYLYLRQTNEQKAGRFRPDWAFNNILQELKNEVKETDESEVYTTYNGLFSNNPFYYENKVINLYYLGYSVTDVLFRSLNAKQFLNYLETNYNLKLSVNAKYKYEKGDGTIEVYTRKQIKINIAKTWLNFKSEVLQVLALHSLDRKIKAELEIKQLRIKTDLQKFVIDEIKDFEKLYKYKCKLENLGVNDPDKILIKKELAKPDTLNSTHEINKELTLLKLGNVIMNPKNKNDMKEAERLVKFAEWCENKKEFTYLSMCKELKKHRIFKNSAYSQKMIFTVLEWFKLSAHRNTKTNLIKVAKTGY